MAAISYMGRITITGYSKTFGWSTEQQLGSKIMKRDIWPADIQNRGKLAVGQGGELFIVEVPDAGGYCYGGRYMVLMDTILLSKHHKQAMEKPGTWIGEKLPTRPQAKGAPPPKPIQLDLLGAVAPPQRAAAKGAKAAGRPKVPPKPIRTVRAAAGRAKPKAKGAAKAKKRR